MRTNLGLAYFFGALVLPVLGRAFVVNAPDVPAERLIISGQKAIAQHPEDVNAHYQLGRIYYVAFSRGVSILPGWEVKEGSVPPLHVDPVDWHNEEELASARQDHAKELALHDLGLTGDRIPPGRRDKLRNAQAKWLEKLERSHWVPVSGGKESEMRAHAAGALKELSYAVKTQPHNALYLLTLAGFEEQFCEWKAIRKPSRLSAEFRRINEGDVKQTYLNAFNAAVAATYPEDISPLDPSYRDLLTGEAARGYIRFSETDLVVEKYASILEVKVELAQIDERARKLAEARKASEDGQISLISPMIFSLDPEAQIADLLAPEIHVDFDLRGFGPRQHWSWVKPQTGLLVWDPNRRGQIVSGQQLFGSYTFQLFRATGYDALAALDDDGDGYLRGNELRGIRVWFDTNSDGHCQPEEVRDLNEFDIVGIAVRATGKSQIHPTNPEGILLKDGRTLSTWDWMTKPISGEISDSPPAGY